MKEEEAKVQYNDGVDPITAMLQAEAREEEERKRAGTEQSTDIERARSVFARKGKYPWAEWLQEGKLVTLTWKVHFQTPPETFRVTLMNTAKRRGWKHVITSVDGYTVSFIVTQNDETYRSLKEGTADEVRMVSLRQKRIAEGTEDPNEGRWVEADEDE